MSSGLYGRRIDQDNYLTGAATVGGQLIGWEFPSPQAGKYCWTFRRDVSEFFDATEDGATFTVKGLTDGSAVALLRWNPVPMTTAQLNALELTEGQLLEGGNIYGVGGNRQGQRQAFWTAESAAFRPNYNESQVAAAKYRGFEGGNPNEALVHYLQARLASTNPSIVGLQAEAAKAGGARDWNGVGFRELENL